MMTTEEIFMLQIFSSPHALQQRLSVYPNIKFLSHSIDPLNDTPERLLDYANEMRANLLNWNFVTGEKESIYNIAKEYFVNAVEDSLAPGGFFHSEYFVLVDKEGNLIDYWYSLTSPLSSKITNYIK